MTSATLKPTVAFPHLPENTRTIDEITEDVVIDQSVIGSCTNGRIEDLRCAAEILKGTQSEKGCPLYRDPGNTADLSAGYGEKDC